MITSYTELHDYPRRVLLVVIGKTPQIVTETLYRLTVQTERPFVPTEVHLITTQEGADSARNALLGVADNQGWIHQFQLDFNLPDLGFTNERIHVIRDTEGAFLDDSESTEHNRTASDYITRVIYKLCCDATCALHVSLAGGRKTMSFYAGYALSLYGRNQDRLSHVLVDLPFQSNKDFFYPRPKPERIEVGNQYYNTHDAKIILSDIPFVRMRYGVPPALLRGEAGYQESVDRIQQLNAPPVLKFQKSRTRLSINGIDIELKPVEYCYYLWMCQRSLQEQGVLEPALENSLQDFLALYAELFNEVSGLYERVEEVLGERVEEDKRKKGRLSRLNWVQARNSNIKKVLNKELGVRMAKAFLVTNVGRKNQPAYGVMLEDVTVKIE